MRIIVNDIAASQSGALTVLKSFYEYVKEHDKENEYVFLLSDRYLKETERIKVCICKNVKKNGFEKLRFDFITGKRFIEKLHPDYVLSLQNIITFGLKCRQGVYIHQAIPFQNTKKFSFLKKSERVYAVYQYLIGGIIKKSIKKSDDVFVQTEWMKKSVKACIEKADAQIITLALRRANEGGLANILDYIPDDVTLLPNTSGARNAKEAVRIARLSRELGCGDFVKVEVVHDSKYLLPDNYETIKATEILAKEGFVVMPYMYPDLNAARALADAGAACIMPLGAPIGSNKGLCTKEFIQILIDEMELPIIVDAGIGRPSQACEAMEMGAAAVMANTAIATAGDVPAMAEAFKKAIEAGRSAYLSGLGRTIERGASASSPLTGFLQD